VSSPRLACLVLAAAGALAASGHARSVSAWQTPVAREGVTGLTVDFVAVQPDGAPAMDLKAGEVEIRISGRLRTVRALRRVATAPLPQSAPRSAPPPFGTNDTVASGRSFALVVDDESLSAAHVQLLKNAVDGLLEELTPTDHATVVTLPFGGAKTPFTSDRARIKMAVGAIAAQGTRNETGSDLACRTRRFLESLETFLQAQAGRSSPLTVVVFTAGLAAPRRDAAAAEAPGMCELPITHFQRVTTVAGAARANFFIAQPDDIALGIQRSRESISGAGYLGSDNPLEGIENLAGVTGGVRVPLNATGSASLLRVAAQSSAYYVAEIDREPNEPVGRSQTLDVRVSRRDVTVRARPEITFLEPRPGARVTRLALPDLLLTRDAFTDVRLRVAGFTVRESDAKLRLGLVVEPADDAVELASVGAVLIDNGDVVSRWVGADTLGRPLLGAMPAREGTYRLRVVAIDSGGRIGAAEDIVHVGLTRVGPLSLGSLLLGISRHDTLIPQLQFGTEPTAIASFDIYGGAAGMRMAAVVEVARDLSGPAIVALPLALARADEGRVVAKGAVPIGALPPGDYVVRGVIRLEDGTTGRVTRTLRKVAK
jgi:hypothetical protein